MISIIIPIYNTSKYLGQCIESILCQSYRNIEIILVNDGSTDNSIDICNLYKKLDSRVIILNKEKNEGLSKARFSGLKISRGEYVMWVDSDDWLEPDILSLMYKTIEKEKVDYVEMSVQRVFDRHKWIKKKIPYSIQGRITQPELFDKYFISFMGVNLLPINIWGKLYRKSTLNKAQLQPSNVTLGEDLFFNMSLFPYLKSIYILNNVGYNYRFGGMTCRYNTNLYSDLRYLYFLKEQLISKYRYDKALKTIRIEFVNIFCSDICQMISYHVGNEQVIKEEILKRMQDPIWQHVFSDKEFISNNHNTFYVALLRKDVDGIYDFCRKKVRRELPLKLLKRMLSFISKII